MSIEGKKKVATGALTIFCREDGRLDFDAMDGFMTFILKAIKEHGSRAARVFPPESEVVLLFAQRVANELV